MAQSSPSMSLANTKKRKDAPNGSSNAKSLPNKKQKVAHQVRRRDARTLSTQTTSKAFQNGALDVSAFVKAREFEIHALEQGIQRSGKANNRRAFQLVPKELRRRTASHNAKRVPKRLRARAEKEMIEDNTPTVNARTRKPTRHMRLRLDTLKRLRALNAQKKAISKKAASKPANLTEAPQEGNAVNNVSKGPVPTVKSRKPKVKKKASLAHPPTPKAKFRKRQIHKTWLPTHLFHTKRAHMTPPSCPLWRFAIPLTPTQKGYRPTHRAMHDRGAVSWDTSYMCTIGLEGTKDALDIVLRGFRVDVSNDVGKWKDGLRARTAWAFHRDVDVPISPVTVIWCAGPTSRSSETLVEMSRKRRKLFIRTHPSAFTQVWEEVVRLASIAKPTVSVEDLRFEIGSIEIAGPGSTEALLSALWPVESSTDGGVRTAWRSLAGLTTPATLPDGALLGFEIQDPRLHHPPRTIALPRSQPEYDSLLGLIADWPIDRTQGTASLFSRQARQQGARLCSQKTINRRKSAAAPGTYPDALPTDPQIPVLIHATPSVNPTIRNRHGSSWTLLAPWKAIQPIWYTIQYYPLSTGQQPRFGGLKEQRQLAFEAGQAWFPADFPGTKAGWEWEMQERTKRLDEWKRRPKGKRVSWEKVDSGCEERGEIGLGWACDWKFLLRKKDESDRAQPGLESESLAKPAELTQLSPTQAATVAGSTTSQSSIALPGRLMTVRLSLITRGVPQTCARIYRLPFKSTELDLRKAWLALRPDKTKSGKKHGSKIDAANSERNHPSHILQQRLARSLLQPSRAEEKQYPKCPAQEDLIGFVTTGNFNLAEGRGAGIGCLMVEKVFQDSQTLGEEGKLCVIRNSGEEVGRLAMWEVV